MNINFQHKAAFIAIFTVLSIHFKFYETINLGPQSTDLWRQADCYSIALNYYQNGFHFFKPQVHFLFSQNGYAAGEFPIIYFLSAILFKFFGVHFFLFKGLNLCIFFLGLYFLFKLTFRFTNHYILSYFICILYFCTPVVFFYANNFLSDVSALSFNIIGLYLFQRFFDTQKIKILSLAAFCFALAGLLKASASILVIAILCSVILELWFADGKSVFYDTIKKYKYRIIAHFLISILLIISWYSYAIRFNQSNQTVFFGTKAMKGWPIWENNFMQIKDTLNNFRLIHVEILSPLNLALFVICMLTIIVFRKKTDAFYFKLLSFLCMGLGMFIAYFWKGFQDQQYYLVNLIILPILTCLIAFNILSKFDFSKINFYTKATMLCCALFAIYTGKNIYKCYYKGGWRHQKLDAVYYDNYLETKLLTFGIDKSSKIISLDDGTPNGTLAMLNRSGWSSYGFNSDRKYKVFEFESKIKMGASFLILNDTSFLKHEVIKLYTQNPIGTYKNLRCYKLTQ
ncbi:MAG TPA: hypothetical protein PK323_00320 [Bacteroidia bacterium]|nr:hypothetical protein [Bacteroidia bacterium]